MDQSVEDLRAQLKSLGYLSHGIERWFGLDPWSSRTFWAELLLISVKAAAIATPFAALPMTAVMLIRNRPLPVWDASLLLAGYVLTGFICIAAVVLATAGLLKIRPLAVIRRPANLLWISLAEAAVVVGWILVWWAAFPEPPSMTESVIVVGLLLMFLPVGTIAFSAALLSFSIYETHQIPSIHRRSRTVPLTIAGAVMLALLVLVVPGARSQAGTSATAQQVVVTPTDSRVALLAVDGLTREVLGARRSTMDLVPHVASFAERASGNAPETWASIGTGTPPEIHGVRAIDAVRLAGSQKLLQSISSADITLRLLTRLGLGRKQPLPPAIRERDYVWEILGSRDVPSAGINWWASPESQQPNLQSISQESVYAATAQQPDTPPVELALAIDGVAIERLRNVSADPSLRFVTAYLPALDIVSNRVELPNSVRLAASVRVLDNVDAAVAELEQAGWDVLLVGTDFVASTRQLRDNAARLDVAPTVLDHFGFPASREMPGTSLSPASSQQRIRSYGPRRGQTPEKVDEEYYEKLKSLGYVR
jgi:hypothetical protein